MRMDVKPQFGQPQSNVIVNGWDKTDRKKKKKTHTTKILINKNVTPMNNLIDSISVCLAHSITQPKHEIQFNGKLNMK